MYKYVDYEETYGRIMQFGKNKSVPIHRWYPFVEGYSKEFILSIIQEQEKKPEICLEPFSGSGTTPLELQEMGIKCYSFDVNPFMYTLSSVKLNAPKYSVTKIKSQIGQLKKSISQISSNSIDTTSKFPTLVQGDDKKKWNLDKSVYCAIQKIITSINLIDETLYQNLYRIALASILPNISNMYRNGKCLSYKDNWQQIQHSEEEVINDFFNVLNDIFIEDLENFHFKNIIDNSKYLFCGDSRDSIIAKVPNDSIGLVITSPPYLNSRDYTDSYMLELKALGYVNSYEDITSLREKTIRSHVQLKWENCLHIDNELLNNTLHEMKKFISKENEWNEEIPNMISAYFVDMEQIFKAFYKKMKKGGIVYFNISNSAYYNVLINTIEIISNIAEHIGFDIVEIRKARYLKTSPQQKEKVGKLLEGVIVLKKP